MNLGETYRSGHRPPVPSMFLLLSVAPSCLAQEAKTRVINGANGRPLPKLAVSVSFLNDKKFDKEIPTNYVASLELETDENGEAHFKFPQPPLAHFSAQVRLDKSHWHCGCGILGSAEDLVREGISGPIPSSDHKKPAARYKATPGEILVIAGPFSFLERLLYPADEGIGRSAWLTALSGTWNTGSRAPGELTWRCGWKSRCSDSS